jgi:hypothetical protein
MLKTVRLELARNPRYPEGSARHGYEIVVPLDAEGHIDAAAWRENRDTCHVRRFWSDQPDERGELIHGRHGWAISYAPGESDDERIFRLDRHLFRVGEYVSISEPDDVTYTFKVVSVA